MGWRRSILFAPIFACGYWPDGGPGVLGAASFFPAAGTEFATGSSFDVIAICDAACTTEIVDTTTVSGAQRGWQAIVARDSKKSVVDFAYMHVLDADNLTLGEHTYNPGTKTVGNSITVDATLFSKSKPLSGDYRCTWTMSVPNVATYTNARNDCVVSFIGPGDLTITATCLGLTQSLSWTVGVDADASLDGGGDAADD